MLDYIHNVLSALSVLLSVAAGGKPYQPISARQYYNRVHGRMHFEPLVNYIFRSEEHCFQSYFNWRLAYDEVNKRGYTRKRLLEDLS